MRASVEGPNIIGYMLGAGAGLAFTRYCYYQCYMLNGKTGGGENPYIAQY